MEAAPMTRPSILQAHEGELGGDHYLPSTVANVSWGLLPTADTPAVLTMRSGETVAIDTVSHEGILEDQGRDPLAFFARHGVAASDVLRDAAAIAAEYAGHDPRTCGPHVVTGPIHVADAQPGDVLKVDFLRLVPRAGYGIISSRHGRGALPGEMPLTPGTVSLFCAVDGEGDALVGSLRGGGDRALRFPLAPFLGIVGVTPAGSTPLHSVPPGPFGGNMDVRDLVAGTTLYLPVQVPGAGLFVGDPHYAQGHGEVALTALEAPLRATLRVNLLPAAQSRAILGVLDRPFAETSQHWIVLGLHRDLNEAFRQATREALRALKDLRDVPPEIAYAYLSAAADFVVTQVVDDVKGVHCLIRKADFARWG
jgi:acetamidase/formamidase